MSEPRIVSLTTQEEFDGCVDLQMQTWNYTSSELFPRRIFLIASRIGGQVLGAVDEDRIVGFSLAMPAFRAGGAYLHSQMLAVSPRFRNSGIGYRLKLAQREMALQQGFDLIEWTFDPLEIKNSYLNLRKLGAISRRYFRDFYGPSTSPLQGGLPTDRLYAEWWIRSARVEQALKGDPEIIAPESTVTVPAELATWKSTEGERHRALKEQGRIADDLEAAFASGLAATGYERRQDGSGAFLLSRWSPANTALRAGDEQ